MSKSPRRLSEQTEASPTGEIQEILQLLIPVEGGVTEDRLQKEVFYAEAIFYEEYGKRLCPTLTWRAFMFGMFAAGIRETITALEPSLSTRKVVRNGGCTTTYSQEAKPSADEVGLTESKYEFLTDVRSEVRETSVEDLVAWAKDHPLYKQTGYDSGADFTVMETLD